MLKRISICFFLATTTCANAQQNCDIIKEYNQVFSITKENDDKTSYLRKTIQKIDKKYCFSDLVNNNNIYVDYLLINFASNEHYQKMLAVEDKTKLQEQFIKNLQQDTLFNKVMTEWVGKTVQKTATKDSVSFDQVMGIAVKYFSILRIRDGNYIGKICVGVNDIKKTEPKRHPHIEAFCFASIIQNVQSKEFGILEEFQRLASELYKINLGIDEQERLLRAQGAMFFLMRNSEKLQKMLWSVYEKQQTYLPFVIKKG